MIQSRLTSLLFIFLFSFSVRSQNQYQPLKCSGEIPAEFRTLLSAKVQKSMTTESTIKRTYSDKKSVVDFISKSNRSLDELLTSGKVLFGDSISNYLDRVASIILKFDPETKEQLRFYAIKSDEVNAFATSEGAIFVTIGLMARLENEAQLAYVLAHEITHFLNKHSISMVLEENKIESNSNINWYHRQGETIAKLSAFSKEFEMEADQFGLYLLAKAGYSKDGAKSMLEILLKYSLEIEEKKFDPHFMELDSMLFPAQFTVDTMQYIIDYSSERDDKYSSHPNIRKRQAAIESLLKDMSGEEGELFFLGEQKFNQIKLLAQYETIHLNILNQNYVYAIYNAQVQLQSDPDNQYIEESLGKALYGLSRYKSCFDYNEIKDGYINSKGQLQRCYSLFYILSNGQINIIAIRYLLYLEEKYNTPFITKLLDDLIQDGIVNEKLSGDQIRLGIKKLIFSNTSTSSTNTVTKELISLPYQIIDTKDAFKPFPPFDTSKVSLPATFPEIKTTPLLSGVDLSKSSDEGKFTGNMNFHYRCFADSDLDLFSARIDSLKKAKTEMETKKMEFDQYMKANKRRFKRNGYRFGIDKVVFVDPFLYSFDLTDGFKINDSESELNRFKRQIGECSEIAGLQYDLLHPKSMSASDVEKYNNMALMNDWVGEKLFHESIERDVISLETEYTSSLKDFYGTPYFCFSGFSTSKVNIPWLRTLPIFVLAWPLFPLYVIHAIRHPRYRSEMYFLLFDVEAGESLWTLKKNFRGQAKKAKVNSYLFDILYQVSNKGGK
jgi:beta-barrel assembly-enhancing protease